MKTYSVALNQGYLCHFNNDIIGGKFGKAELLKDVEFLRAWGNPRISLGEQTSEFVLPLFRRILLEYSENGLKIWTLFSHILQDRITPKSPEGGSVDSRAKPPSGGWG